MESPFGNNERLQRSLPAEQPEMLWEWFRRERVLPLLLALVLAELASCVVIAADDTLLSGLYQEVLLYGLQFGILSCLALWMVLVARSWYFRVPASIAVFAAAMLVITSYRAVQSIEVATLFAAYVAVLSLVALLLRLTRVISSPCAKSDVRTLPRFGLRRVFIWTTVVAGLAFLTRYAELPLDADVILASIGCVLISLAVFLLATYIRRLLLFSGLTLMAIVLIEQFLHALSTAFHFGVFATLHLAQATIVLVWIAIDRTGSDQGRDFIAEDV